MLPDQIMRWLGPCILGVIGFVLITGNPVSTMMLCAGSERCLLDWVGALSGWAAAIGAGIAAGVTVGPLREQVREARRQADFTCGDAEPEFVLLRNMRENQVKLRVTNWNRRTVMIERIRCVQPTDLIVGRVRDADKESGRHAASGTHKAFRLNGWFDRSSVPPRRHFVLEFLQDGEILVGALAAEPRLAVDVQYRIMGQYHQRRRSSVVAIGPEDGPE